MEDKILESVVAITCAWVTARSPYDSTQISTFIRSIHSSIECLVRNETVKISEKQVVFQSMPKEKIAETFSNDYIICLEDGRRMKTLKRHLKVKFNLSPREYRLKWGLPHDYSMTCPSYSKKRSMMAKKLGLGKLAG